MKVKIETTTLEIQGKQIECVVWADVADSDGQQYRFLIPKDLYLELFKAVAVDEANLYRLLSLYEIHGENYVFVESPEKKKEVYLAIARQPKKAT